MLGADLLCAWQIRQISITRGLNRGYCAAIQNSTGFNIDSPKLVCARLRGLYQCTMPSRQSHCDVALVRKFNPTSWKPATRWDGCKVHEDSLQYTFVVLNYLICGAHMIPAFDAPKSRDNKEKFHFNDLNDMFLQV